MTSDICVLASPTAFARGNHGALRAIRRAPRARARPLPAAAGARLPRARRHKPARPAAAAVRPPIFRLQVIWPREGGAASRAYSQLPVRKVSAGSSPRVRLDACRLASLVCSASRFHLFCGRRARRVVVCFPVTLPQGSCPRRRGGRRAQPRAAVSRRWQLQVTLNICPRQRHV